MTITGTEQAILIILAIFLALFLLLSIVALIFVIKILVSTKRIIHKAEDVVDRAENVAKFFEKTTVPSAITKLVSNITDTFFRKDQNK